MSKAGMFRSASIATEGLIDHECGLRWRGPGPGNGAEMPEVFL
jgi:hypothetical protein